MIVIGLTKKENKYYTAYYKDNIISTKSWQTYDACVEYINNIWPDVIVDNSNCYKERSGIKYVYVVSKLNKYATGESITNHIVNRYISEQLDLPEVINEYSVVPKDLQKKVTNINNVAAIAYQDGIYCIFLFIDRKLYFLYAYNIEEIEVILEHFNVEIIVHEEELFYFESVSKITIKSDIINRISISDIAMDLMQKYLHGYIDLRQKNFNIPIYLGDNKFFAKGKIKVTNKSPITIGKQYKLKANNFSELMKVNKSKYMQQYIDARIIFPNAIILIQCGYFYDIYFEDALLVSEICGYKVITEPTYFSRILPKTGVPVTKVDSFIEKMSLSGKKIILLEQTGVMEDGILLRKIVEKN